MRQLESPGKAVEKMAVVQFAGGGPSGCCREAELGRLEWRRPVERKRNPGRRNPRKCFGSPAGSGHRTHRGDSAPRGDESSLPGELRYFSTPKSDCFPPST